MTIRKICIQALMGMLALGAAVAQAADDRGFYVGADMGVARFPDEATLNVGAVMFRPTDVSDEQFTWSVTSGYWFNRYFAAEVGYVDLGELTASLEDVSGANGGQGRLRLGVDGPTVAVLGRVPFGKWYAFGKVGLMFPDVALDVSGTTGATPFRGRLESDASHVFLGLGVGYAVSDQLHLKLALNHHIDVGDDNAGLTVNADITSVTLGFEYRF